MSVYYARQITYAMLQRSQKNNNLSLSSTANGVTTRFIQTLNAVDLCNCLDLVFLIVIKFYICIHLYFNWEFQRMCNQCEYLIVPGKWKFHKNYTVNLLVYESLCYTHRARIAYMSIMNILGPMLDVFNREAVSTPRENNGCKCRKSKLFCSQL